MVGLPSYGLESQNYFSTKQNKGARAAASDNRHSPKSSKFQQTRPLSQYNGQNLNMSQPKLKSKSPSVNKQSNKQHSERQYPATTTSSPKPIPHNKNSRTNQSSLRSSPSSTRSSPPRSTISPSRSSPNNFASSQCYQPPTPSSLPKPPVAWTASDSSVNSSKSSLKKGLTAVADPTAHLKLLLNVQA